MTEQHRVRAPDGAQQAAGGTSENPNFGHFSYDSIKKRRFSKEWVPKFSPRGCRPTPLFGRTPPSAVTGRRPPGEQPEVARDVISMVNDILWLHFPFFPARADASARLRDGIHDTVQRDFSQGNQALRRTDTGGRSPSPTSTT